MTISASGHESGMISSAFGHDSEMVSAASDLTRNGLLLASSLLMSHDNMFAAAGNPQNDLPVATCSFRQRIDVHDAILGSRTLYLMTASIYRSNCKQT